MPSQKLEHNMERALDLMLIWKVHSDIEARSNGVWFVSIGCEGNQIETTRQTNMQLLELAKPYGKHTPDSCKFGSLSIWHCNRKFRKFWNWLTLLNEEVDYSSEHPHKIDKSVEKLKLGKRFIPCKRIFNIDGFGSIDKEWREPDTT